MLVAVAASAAATVMLVASATAAVMLEAVAAAPVVLVASAASAVMLEAEAASAVMVEAVAASAVMLVAVVVRARRVPYVCRATGASDGGIWAAPVASAAAAGSACDVIAWMRGRPVAKQPSHPFHIQVMCANSRVRVQVVVQVTPVARIQVIDIQVMYSGNAIKPSQRVQRRQVIQ